MNVIASATGPDPLNPQPATAKPPNGWWSLPDLSGSLDAVLRAIDQADQVPAHWKAAIKADLQLLCAGDKNFVWLDVHFHLEKANAILHYHATAEKKLL